MVRRVSDCRRHSLRVSVLLTLFALAACGRSATPTVPCPAPADDCAALLEQQAGLEAVYADASDDGADVGVEVRRDSAACLQLVTDRVVDLGCAAPCDELCRLHPCAVLDDDGNRQAASACPARCEALLEDQSIVAADLPLVIDKAAENPGFCTCRACVTDDDAFCTQLFDCAIE